MPWILDLSGKTALVTGGARGIGRAIVETLARAGARVAYCSLRPESLGEAAAYYQPIWGDTVMGRAADVKSRESVRALFAWVDDTFSGLDVLVNNAGVGRFGALGDLSEEDWDEVIGTNLTGTYHCMREAIPRFRQRGGGTVVNISSLASKNPFAGGAAYNASKFGLQGLSEAAMLDHRYEGVRVHSILPGSVSTGFGRSGPADWKIAPEDVAETVAWVLASPERTLVSSVEIRPAKPRKG